MTIDCRRRDAHATIILDRLGGPDEVLDFFVDISSGARDIVALIRDLVVIGTALFVIVAGILGANYGFSPADIFIIWLLMAILIKQSLFNK